MRCTRRVWGSAHWGVEACRGEGGIVAGQPQCSVPLSLDSDEAASRVEQACASSPHLGGALADMYTCRAGTRAAGASAAAGLAAGAQLEGVLKIPHGGLACSTGHTQHRAQRHQGCIERRTRCAGQARIHSLQEQARFRPSRILATGGCACAAALNPCSAGCEHTWWPTCRVVLHTRVPGEWHEAAKLLQRPRHDAPPRPGAFAGVTYGAESAESRETLSSPRPRKPGDTGGGRRGPWAVTKGVVAAHYYEHWR